MPDKFQEFEIFKYFSNIQINTYLNIRIGSTAHLEEQRSSDH